MIAVPKTDVTVCGTSVDRDVPLALLYINMYVCIIIVGTANKCNPKPDYVYALVSCFALRHRLPLGSHT
jgi:hypothetical protein